MKMRTTNRPLALVAALLGVLLLLASSPAAARCGDGVVEAATEQCDDRNTASGDGCSSACRIELCWVCEGSPSVCRLVPRCGDRVVCGWEECDNGELNSDSLPDACRSDCRLPWCGDDVRDPGNHEECDEGIWNSNLVPDACRTTCVLPSCGDGVRDSAEMCDEGGPTATCTGACGTVECGNGTVDPGEICDDHNTDDADVCRASCVPNTCGDGAVNLDPVPSTTLFQEVCDGAIETCRYDCGESYSSCGDGLPDQGEECDEGAANSDAPDAACRTTCMESGCGDGVVDSGEECDRHPGCGPDCRLLH